MFNSYDDATFQARIDGAAKLKTYHCPIENDLYPEWSMTDDAWAQAKTEMLGRQEAILLVLWGKYSCVQPTFLEKCIFSAEGLTVFDLYKAFHEILISPPILRLDKVVCLMFPSPLKINHRHLIHL